MAPKTKAAAGSEPPSAKKLKPSEPEWSTAGLGAHAAELDFVKLYGEKAGKRLAPGDKVVKQTIDGREMTEGGESVEYALPDICARGVLSMVILEHRKATENKEDMASVKYDDDPSKKGAFVDSKGAYTRVEVKFAGKEQWFTYLSFGYAQKFAEPRHVGQPEVEGLHDYPAQKCGPAIFDRIRLTSVGLSAVHVHKLRVHCYPPEKVLAGAPEPVILTPHTRFGDYVPSLLAGGKKPSSIKKPVFGGGEDGLHLVEASLAGSEYKPGLSALYPGAAQIGSCPGAGGVVNLGNAPDQVRDGLHAEC